MKKYLFSVLLITGISAGHAQLTCSELRDKSNINIASLHKFTQLASPTEQDFAELTAAYTSFRDWSAQALATETDYDFKLLLQVFALQNGNQFLQAAIQLNKFDLAWKEMKYTHDNIYTKINYQKIQSRKDNWVACSILAESKKLEIHEIDYRNMCTDFIGTSYLITSHYKKDQLFTTLYAEAGLRGLLTSGTMLHRMSGEILNMRLEKNQLDDTTYLAAYKFLLTDRDKLSMASISADFTNMSFAKALDVLTNPALVVRSATESLKNMDQYDKISYRYDNLYAYLAADSGFVFSGKFDLLRIALSAYLSEMRAIKPDNHSFHYVPQLYQMLDAGYESGDGYTVRKEMEKILNSGNNELISELAEVYEMYGKYCYGYYPDIEKAHYYYSAYRCYVAIGDTKKAKKAFNDIPNSMLANKHSLGYKKLD